MVEFFQDETYRKVEQMYGEEQAELRSLQSTLAQAIHSRRNGESKNSVYQMAEMAPPPLSQLLEEIHLKKSNIKKLAAAMEYLAEKSDDTQGSENQVAPLDDQKIQSTEASEGDTPFFDESQIEFIKQVRLKLFNKSTFCHQWQRLFLTYFKQIFLQIFSWLAN